MTYYIKHITINTYLQIAHLITYLPIYCLPTYLLTTRIYLYYQPTIYLVTCLGAYISSTFDTYNL